MKENVQKLLLLPLLTKDFPTAIEQAIEMLRDDFEKAGWFSPEIEQSLESYKQVLLSSKEQRDQRIAAVYEEHFTDEEVERLVEFFSSEATALVVTKHAQFMHLFSHAINLWLNDMIKSVPNLQETVRKLTESWLKNNIGEHMDVESAIEDTDPPPPQAA